MTKRLQKQQVHPTLIDEIIKCKNSANDKKLLQNIAPYIPAHIEDSNMSPKRQLVKKFKKIKRLN